MKAFESTLGNGLETWGIQPQLPKIHLAHEGMNLVSCDWGRSDLLGRHWGVTQWPFK